MKTDTENKEVFLDDTPVDVYKLPQNTMTDEEFEEYRKQVRIRNGIE